MDLLQDRRVRILVIALSLLPMAIALGTYLVSIAVNGPYGTLVFSTYWASGHALFTGQNPYAWLPETYSGTIDGKLYGDLNLNPPMFLPVAQLFALVPLMPMARAWQVFTAGLFVLLILFVANRGKVGLPKTVWALFLPAFSNALQLGQNYAILFGLAVLLWRMTVLGRRDMAALALGLIVAFKPNFALAMIALFAAGHYRFALRSAAYGLVAAALPILFYGPDIYLKWLAAMQGDFHYLMAATASIPAYFQRLEMGSAGLAVAAAVGLACLFELWRRKPPLEVTVIVGLALGILCSPLAWYHYFMVLVPWLMTQRWDRLTFAACLMMLFSPDLVQTLAKIEPFGPVTFGGYFMLVTALLLVGAMRNWGQESAVPGRESPPSLSLGSFREDVRRTSSDSENWSGKEDSNLRPLPPEDSALPG